MYSRKLGSNLMARSEPKSAPKTPQELKNVGWGAWGPETPSKPGYCTLAAAGSKNECRRGGCARGGTSTVGR